MHGLPSSRPNQALTSRLRRTCSTQNRRTASSVLLSVKPDSAFGWAKSVALKSTPNPRSRAHSTQPA